ENGIYIAVEVKDDFIRTNYTYNSRFDREVWLNSGVGIYFKVAETLYNFRMATNGLIRVYKSLNGSSWTTTNQDNLFSDGSITDFKRALKVYGTTNLDTLAEGFTMEFFFPYTTLGTTYNDLQDLTYNVLVTEQWGQTNASYTINDIKGEDAIYDNPALTLYSFLGE
ncbi:MAG: hypothetical protein LBM99_01995, partial [Bacillales bacterium]|nr:hypothetical protein [Bacillales bacterium]